MPPRSVNKRVDPFSFPVFVPYCNHPIQPAPSQNCTSNVHPSTVAATSDGRSYTYDANGNTLTGAGRSLTWNSDNRLQFLTAPGGSVTSVYDHTGTRIKKTGAGGTTFYPFAGYEIDPSGVVTKYIRLGTEMLAAKKGGEKLFYHNDHQGGVNVITNIFAAIVQLNEYDPWGKVSRSENDGSNPEPTKRFNGKELDAESGLYYYGGRYHDPDLARFVSADSFVQDPGNPQNLNRYSYTINNPQKYVDPSGHFFGLIFSLIFKGSTASKLWAGTDPFGFLLSKIPKKVNAGFNIFGGVAMLLTGNPAGAFFIASGAMSFGKGNGFQIASQLLGLAGAATTILGGGGTATGASTGPGNDHPNESGGGFDSLLAANALGASSSSGTSQQAHPRRHIPSELFGGKIKFWPAANQPIDERAVEVFGDAVAQTKLDNPGLKSLLITATTNGTHSPGSYHYSGSGALAVDIGAINDVAINGGYSQNTLVQEITKSLQINLRSPVTLENFGPYFLEKGQFPFKPSANLIQSHQSHIHFAVTPP